jgi:hypothetical protein
MDYEDALQHAGLIPDVRLHQLYLQGVAAGMAAQPAPVQEPVAWVVEDEHGERLEWAGDAHSCHGLPTLPLYTTPPAAQRQWVGLTDEEIKTVIAKIDPNEH